jgi:hypothetical protein
MHDRAEAYKEAEGKPGKSEHAGSAASTLRGGARVP